MIRFTGEIDGIPVLDRAFNRIEDYIADFRNVWPDVATEFYRIEREQFDSQGAAGLSGKWPELSPPYKKWKATHYPNEPILRLEHPLVDSLTQPDALDSIFIVTPTELTIGSKTPYAVAHQRGGGHLPKRPPISLTDASKRRLQKAIQRPLVQFIRRQGFRLEEAA